jgi:putative ABC transport system substrate-binding protein
MALLKRAAPKVSSIGILASPDNPPFDIQLADAKRAAVELGVEVTPYTVKSREAIEQALIDMVAKGMNGLVHFQSGLTLAHRQFIVDFAAQHRLPAIYQATRFVEAGGLMAWSPDQEEQFREAARFADKILRGARPGELAIRYPKKYFLTINARAAKGLDLSLPADLFKEADRVIV